MFGRKISVKSFFFKAHARRLTHIKNIWQKKHISLSCIKANFSTNGPSIIPQSPILKSQCVTTITDVDPDNEDDYNIPDDSDDDDEEEEEIKSIGAARRDGIIKAKTRQHVNPLAQSYQRPLVLANNWLKESFAQPRNPVHIDIGCARGTWVLKMGQINPSLNILGLEIRRPIVDLCLVRKKVWKLNNVHFLSANANVHLETIFSSLKGENAPVESVSIQFPDPHFKKRHHKRRVVNPDFVRVLANFLKPNVKVFIQSDIFDVFEDIIQHFNSSIYFDGAPTYDSKNFERNISPFPIKTERETSTLKKDLPVYRMLYLRNTKEFTIESARK